MVCLAGVGGELPEERIAGRLRFWLTSGGAPGAGPVGGVRSPPRGRSLPAEFGAGTGCAGGGAPPLGEKGARRAMAAVPERWRFTVDAYQRLAEAGIPHRGRPRRAGRRRDRPA